MAVALEPALIQACDGDLSEIEWFRSTWQSGGAATGRAKFSLTDGRVADVIVKLPVGPAEYRWTTGLEGLDAAEGPHCELELGCTPRVFAAGTELGGYDLAWLVVERLPGTPLSHHYDEAALRSLLTAAVDWYERAAALRRIDDASPPPPQDWSALLSKARQAIKDGDIPDHRRWGDAVKQVAKALPRLLSVWDSRPINTWCHGDLHPGNAMHRPPGNSHHPGGGGSGVGSDRCVLIDLALVHAGHWVEDVVYLERLHWGRLEHLHGIKPVSFVARLLSDRGLLGSEDYSLLANVRRVLMGACAPAFLTREGNPRYLHGALEVVEKLLPNLLH